MPTFELVLCRIPFGSVDFCRLFRSFSPLWNGSMHVTRQAHEQAQPQNQPCHDMVRDSRGLAQQLVCLQLKSQYPCIKIHQNPGQFSKNSNIGHIFFLATFPRVEKWLVHRVSKSSRSWDSTTLYLGTCGSCGMKDAEVAESWTKAEF